MDATFTGPGGVDPLEAFRQIKAAVEPTVGDALYGGQLARTFIRDRTARGVDVDGSAFAPYSPGYAKQKAKNGGNTSVVDLFGVRETATSQRKRKKQGTTKSSLGPHMMNGILVKAGGLESSSEDGPEPTIDIWDHSGQTVNQFQVGIYADDLAERMKFNNEGTSRGLPARNAFGVNEQEVNQIEQGIGKRIEARLNSLPK